MTKHPAMNIITMSPDVEQAMAGFVPVFGSDVDIQIARLYREIQELLRSVYKNEQGRIKHIEEEMSKQEHNPSYRKRKPKVALVDARMKEERIINLIAKRTSVC